jgi:putative flippase GtrA
MSLKKSVLISIERIIDLIRRLWNVPFLRFLVVGGINTVFGYSVFALLIYLQLHYVLATLLAQICGVLFNFKTTGTIVFRSKDNRLLLRFALVYVFTYLVNIGLLKLFDMADVGSLVAQAIIVLPLAVVTFVLMKKFVFDIANKKQQPATEDIAE